MVRWCVEGLGRFAFLQQYVGTCLLSSTCRDGLSSRSPADVSFTETETSLPRPFYDEWSRSLRPAAHALWAWHSALAEPQPIESNGTEAAVASFFDEEVARATAGDPMRLLREEVWSDAYAVCDTHDLDRSLLAQQVGAAKALYGTTRFQTGPEMKAFVGQWAVPHGRLLAGLAGVTLEVRLKYADELARGFFHLGRLVSLPADVQKDRLFIPLENLHHRDVQMDDLRSGTVHDGVRGLLWKECVRVRDALAQGRPLIGNLSLRRRFALKRFWVGALEVLNEIERRDFDLWDAPLDLSLFRRMQVYLQTLFGSATAR